MTDWNIVAARLERLFAEWYEEDVKAGRPRSCRRLSSREITQSASTPKTCLASEQVGLSRERRDFLVDLLLEPSGACGALGPYGAVCGGPRGHGAKHRSADGKMWPLGWRSDPNGVPEP